MAQGDELQELEVLRAGELPTGDFSLTLRRPGEKCPIAGLGNGLKTEEDEGKGSTL